jgi:hypothetical protein
MRVPALAKPPKANGPQRHPRVQQWFGTVCSASWSLHTVAVTVCTHVAQPSPRVLQYLCMQLLCGMGCRHSHQTPKRKRVPAYAYTSYCVIDTSHGRNVGRAAPRSPGP